MYLLNPNIINKNKETSEVVIKLNDGKSIICISPKNKLNINQIKKQFLNKDEFIIFGLVGVKRELIDFYMIDFESYF